MTNKETIFIQTGRVQCEEGTVNVYSMQETVDSLAKVVVDHNTGAQKFYLKINSDGLINFICSKPNKRQSKWVQVPEKCWTQYCKFLKTGSVKYLSNAEKFYMIEVKT